MTRTEAENLLDGLNEEELRMVYGYILALRDGASVTMGALDAAAAAKDYERAKEISLGYLEARSAAV